MYTLWCLIAFQISSGPKSKLVPTTYFKCCIFLTLAVMVGVKGLNESDGEEVDQETAESEKTSNDDSESSTPSGSDDEDSSEVDEEDCERRRNECIDDMADLERQFFHLREQLYNERHMQVTLKLDEVKAGVAIEYIQPLEELEETMKIRMEVAKILKELKTKNIQNKADAEQQASHQNFESEKSLLWDSIKSELEEKIRRLEEDRNSIDITSDLWNEQINHRKKRKADTQNFDKRKKPVTVSGPYIVYMLRDNDLLEDWTTIRKALKASKQSSEYEFSPSEQRYSARFADGNLIFKGESFRKGEHVIIEDKLDSWSARVISVNTSEVLLQKQDGSWLRIYICDLQSGKYSIQHAFA